MGILADSADDDIAALTWVAAWSARAYNFYSESRFGTGGLHVEVNHDVITALSEIGGRVLQKHFEAPDLLGRIATLVAVANCYPPFTLSRCGKPVTGIEERRCFFATLCCAFVQAAFAFYKPTAQKGEAGAYVFGFPDGGKRERFYTYLRLMDVGEVTVLKGEGRMEGARKEEEALRTLAKDVVAVTEFVYGCITFEPGANYEGNRLMVTEG